MIFYMAINNWFLKYAQDDFLTSFYSVNSCLLLPFIRQFLEGATCHRFFLNSQLTRPRTVKRLEDTRESELVSCIDGIIKSKSWTNTVIRVMVRPKENHTITFQNKSQEEDDPICGRNTMYFIWIKKKKLICKSFFFQYLIFLKSINKLTFLD